ncbi:MAG: acyl-CoA dehydrogenase family protein, partial [Alphaproteobacteria bacterium]|nr:acyl-CoA dehydrogenase family protein [Alphaproteobacteria bacterium]
MERKPSALARSGDRCFGAGGTVWSTGDGRAARRPLATGLSVEPGGDDIGGHIGDSAQYRRRAWVGVAAVKAPDRFELVDEELALQEAVRKALSGVSPHRALTTEGADLADISRRHWSLAQELGWPGLMVAEAAGGSGLGRRDMTILAEEMGAQLFCGPFLPTAVLATALAELARLQGRMMAVASDIASGRMTVALGASMPTGGVVAAQSSLRMLAESR